MEIQRFRRSIFTFLSPIGTQNSKSRARRKKICIFLNSLHYLCTNLQTMGLTGFDSRLCRSVSTPSFVWGLVNLNAQKIKWQ